MAHPDARNVHVDIEGQELLEKMWRQMERGGPDRNPYRQMFKHWGSVYQSAMRRRFIAMSRGGWQPLAQSTILSRRVGRADRGGTRGKSRTRAIRQLRRTNKNYLSAGKLVSKVKRLSSMDGVSILTDTGQLQDALKPGMPGELRDDIPWGVDVGFSNSTRNTGDLLTMGDLASFHHFGMGNNPERPILVPPDGDARAQMNEAMGAAQRQIASRLNALYRGRQRG